MRVAADAPAMIAKLRTNLAEVYCLRDPELALEEAAVSTEANARLGNRIELAKCDAIRAIALAKLGEGAAAEGAAARAAALANEVGYPAGVAFALQAGAIAHGLTGDRERLLDGFDELSRFVEALGTYGHLRVAPAWMTEDDTLFIESAVDIDWIEPEGLEDRLRRDLRQ
jgi:hypothetical protein